MKIRIAAIAYLPMFVILSLNCAMAADAADKLSIQLRWDHQFRFAGYYAAKWQGYYKQAGFDVEIRSAITPDGKILDPVEEVSKGNADFGIGAANILIARDQGIPLVVLVSIFKQSAAEFYAKEETVFNSPSDLPNLKVARIVNDLIDIELQAMLLSEGIDPNKIKPYPHRTGIEHLVRGQVDVIPGYRISAPYTFSRQGIRVKILRPINYGIDFYGDSLFTHERWIKNNPEAAEHFLNATVKGWVYALEHSAEIADKISQELPRRSDIAGGNFYEFNRFQIKGVKELTLYPIVDVAHTNPHRWQRMHDLIKDLGIIKNPLDIDNFVFDPQKLKIKKEQKFRYFLMIALCGIAGAFFLILASIKMLRMKVAEKTEALQRANEKLQQSTAELETINQQLGDEIAERRRAEEKFRDLFNEQKVILDNAGIGIVFLKNRILFRINKYFEELFGYTSDEILGTSTERLYPSKEQYEETGKVYDKIKRGGICQTEIIMKRKDNTYFWCNLTGAAANPADLNNGSIWLLENIHERRQMQDALRESEEKYRVIFNNEIYAICIFDLETLRFLDVNNAHEKLYGYSREELVSGVMTIHDITVEHEVSDDATKQAIREGTIFIPLRYHRKKDGTIFPVEIVGGTYVWKGRRVMFGLAHDITERKKTEAEVQLFKIIAESSDESVAISDSQGRLIYINPAHEKLFGRSLEEALSCNYRDYYPPESLEILNSQVVPALMRGESWEGILDVHDKSGRRFPLWERAGSILDAEGKMLYGFGFMHDCTKQRQTEEELRKAKKAADAANKAKSEFLANMSHEIRTPISGIIGMIKIMLTYHSEGNARQSLIAMQHSAESLLNIINDILDFSKIEAGKMKLSPAEFDLCYTMEGILSQFGPEAKNNKLFLQLNIAHDVPRYLHGDESRLRQVLINLVGNAVKFTEQGTITMNVEKTDEPYKLLFSVRDTGIGIPENRYADLFESFVQLDVSYFKKYPGTGLGLPISKKLVEMMGGEIRLESKIGKGSTFYFTAMFEKASSEELIKREAEKHAAEPLILPPLKILVAEDDQLNRMAVVHILETAGHDVVSVSDGKQAIEAFKKGHFDVILMDIQMPEMDGIEAARAIKNYESEILNSQFSIPIIALTAYTMKGDREQFINAGMDDYLPKPVDKDELFYTIGKRIGNAAKPEALVTKPRLGNDGVEHCIADIMRYIEQYNDDKEFLNNMLKGFVRETPVRMERLTRAISEKDFEQIAKAAHSMTNLVSAVRIYSSANYSKEIEKAAKNQDIKQVLSYDELLRQEMERIINYLRDRGVFPQPPLF